MKIAVIGGGTMGNGIAHVFAQHGHEVALIETTQDRADKALATIEGNLERQVKKETLTAADAQATLARDQPGDRPGGGRAAPGSSWRRSSRTSR